VSVVARTSFSLHQEYSSLLTAENDEFWKKPV
jgi:hypothetical protein